MLTNKIKQKYEVTSSKHYDLVDMDWEIEDYEVEEEDNSFDHAFGVEKRIEVSVGFHEIYMTDKQGFEPEFIEEMEAIQKGDTISLHFMTKVKDGSLFVDEKKVDVGEVTITKDTITIKFKKMLWIGTDWEPEDKEE